ncbi:MAG TPA: hypothetical protein VNV66_22455 [Pilimelia sp.]|nr:hypothetical protein [Pilimelia sp.]
MANVQQPEMRRTETTSLTQSDTSAGGGRGVPSGGRREHRGPVPPDQASPYGPADRPVAERDDSDES